MSQPVGAVRATRRLAATPAAIAEAADVLRAGGLAAFPTETVYGLGADALNDAAVAALYAAKGRPNFNPLIAHVLGTEEAARIGRMTSEGDRLAEAFWPGPLTLVLPAARGCAVSLLARAGLDSVALRATAHPVARALLRAVGRPIVAPSANLSGRVSPTAASHVEADLAGRIDVILDGGATECGLESTIISCLADGPRLLRPGAIARDRIEAALGRRLEAPPAGPLAPLSPGRLPSHYAPRAAVRLAARSVGGEEGALDFGGQLAGGRRRCDLSPAGDLKEAAARLFGLLRELDASGVATIAVAPIPELGLGEAINDRLRRAAAPRPVSAILRP